MRKNTLTDTLPISSKLPQTSPGSKLEDWKQIRMSYEGKIEFLNQLASYIEASGSYSEWFRKQVEIFDEMLVKEVDSREFKLSGKPQGEEFCRAFFDLCQKGVPFSESVDYFPGVFSPRAMGTLKIAHESKNFEDTLRREAKLLHKELKSKNQLIGAIIYPAIIILVATIFVFIVMTVILPGFTLLYEGLLGNTQMHWTMEYLIAFSRFFKTYWPVAAMVFVGILIGYPSCRKAIPALMDLEDELILKIPIVSDWVLQMETSNYILSLCAVLEVIQSHSAALNLSTSVFANRWLRKRSELAAAALGVSYFNIHESLAAYIPYYGPSSSFFKVLSSYYDTGSTKELEIFATILEEKADATRERVLQLVPHILLIVVGCIVGFAVFAVYIPLLELVGKMANR